MVRYNRLGLKRRREMSPKTSLKILRKDSEPEIESAMHNKERKAETQNPFILLPEDLFPSRLAVSVIEQNEINTTPPRELPHMSTHGPRRVKIGTVLKKASSKKRSDSSVYVRVDAYGRYTISDSKDRPLKNVLYRKDPAYDTEEKLLRAVLNIVKGFVSSLNEDEVSFRSELDAYCSERRSWEVGLVNQLATDGLITISSEELKQLENWRTSYDEEPLHEEDYQWYRTTMALPDSPTGVPTHEWVSFDLIDHVHNAIRSPTRDIQRLQASEEPEQLLIKFDDEGKSSTRQQAEPHYIPPPPRDDAEKYYHWCLERHGRWAREKAFHSFSCHEVHQLAKLEDLPFMDHNDMPRGHHGLIWQLMGHNEPDLEKYPWGLPAHKLYETMRGLDIDDQYWTIAARDFLIDLEQWYHNKPLKVKKELQKTELAEWPLKDKGVLSKRAKLLEMGNFTRIE